MTKVARRDGPEFARDLDIRFRCLLKMTASHQPHRSIDDSLRREPVGGSQFQPKDITREMKRADLASPVGKQLMCPDGAADDLVNVFGRLILAVDFLILAVRELSRDKAHVAGQRAELVSWVGDWSRAAGLSGTIE